MAKGKVGALLIKMLSTAGTGYFYVKARRPAPTGSPAASCSSCRRARAHQPRPAQKKNPKKLATKLEFMKYDPRVMRHVLFQETKLK